MEEGGNKFCCNADSCRDLYEISGFRGDGWGCNKASIRLKRGLRVVKFEYIC